MPSRLSPFAAAALLCALAATLSGCPPPCQPTTSCAAQGLSCGSIDDGCGQTLNCGACSGTGQTCGGGGTPGVCGCTAEADPAFCARLGKNCGPLTAADNCGTSRTVADCGSCSGTGVTCGGGGTQGVCGCTPQSDATFCSLQGRDCGPASGTDNCGASRTVASCGTCSGTGQTCGGGGTQGVCGCTPQTDAQFCAAAGANCGIISGTDNCGATRTNVACGSRYGCGSGSTCGGAGVANRCGVTAAPIAGEVCTLSRLCFEMPKPSDVATATFALSSNDVWAVGQNVIEHWDGARWSGVVLADTYLRDVWASGPNDVWVVGTHYTYPGGYDDPVILRGGPAGFEPVTPYDIYVDKQVFSVSGSGPNDVWLLGQAYDSFNGYYAFLDHWDGTSVQHKLGLASNARLVRVVSPTEQYVIGDNLSQVGPFSVTPINNTTGIYSLQSIGNELWGGGTGGRVFRRQFGTWVSYTVGASTDLFTGVWGSSTSDVWAFGTTQGAFPNAGLVQRFNGASWSPVAGAYTPFSATSWGATPVAVGVGGDIWTVSGGSLARWTGAGLPRPGQRSLNAVSGTDSSHYFIAGSSLLFQNNAGTWTDWSAAGTPTYADDVYMASPTDVWISGGYPPSGASDVRRFNGSTITTTGAGKTGPLGAGLGSVWLGDVSSNALLRWTGSAWAPETTPISGTSGQRITGISAAPGGGLYVTTNYTTNNALVMRKDPGGLWTTVNTGTFFRDVVALSDTQIWVGATNSLYFNGSSWTSSFATLDALSGSSSASVCGAMTSGGIAYRWTGAGWSILDANGYNNYQDVFCDDAGQLYLSGTALWRYHP